MNRRRISDREIRDEILHFSRYGTVGECLSELLRCRRALRKIVRLYDPGDGVTYDMIAKAMWREAKRALGKGEKA